MRAAPWSPRSIPPHASTTTAYGGVRRVRWSDRQRQNAGLRAGRICDTQPAPEGPDRGADTNVRFATCQMKSCRFRMPPRSRACAGSLRRPACARLMFRSRDGISR